MWQLIVIRQTQILSATFNRQPQILSATFKLLISTASLIELDESTVASQLAEKCLRNNDDRFQIISSVGRGGNAPPIVSDKLEVKLNQGLGNILMATSSFCAATTD